MKKFFLLLYGICLCSSCFNDYSDLNGRWQAYAMLEEGEPAEIDLQHVYFQFSPDGTYSYHGTLNYREAGTYRIERKLLYTIDTLHEERLEKAVKIAHLSADSLHFLMNAEGKEQLLKLSKTQ